MVVTWGDCKYRAGRRDLGGIKFGNINDLKRHILETPVLRVDRVGN